MATKKPLVDYSGQKEELRAGDSIAGAAASHSKSMVNGNASPITICQAVYVSGNDEVDLAQANADGTSKVYGLVAATTISAAASGTVQTDGVLVGTTAQWDAVTGETGGLTAGQEYILSPDTPGALVARSTALDAGDWVKPVGVADSTTEMKIALESGWKKN